MPTFRPPRQGISLSEALASAYSTGPEDEVILHTLEFRHSLFAAPYRWVCDHTSLTATLEADAPANPGEAVLFEPVGFQLLEPAVGAELGEFSVTVPNAKKKSLTTVLDAIRDSREKVLMTHRIYLASDLTEPHHSPPLTLTVNRVSGDLVASTIRADFGKPQNLRFPAVEYYSRYFPMLTAR